MTKFALYVPLQAKPGKEKEVAIFDTFDDEAGRDAHLNGKVAAALMEKARAGDLFAKTPEIHKLGILADKLPK
jgi:quinol monooxygenase YgiN